MRTNSELELWGGAECTINRVHDTYIEQLDRTGHSARISDLDLFANLGIKALRQPVLWERTAPHNLHELDWTWPDQWLNCVRELNVRPIVGLVHHGSGPRYTSLEDPHFPEKLSVYARAVASRYPWVTDYTPVNEPLTTARFAALYGFWHPNKRDMHTFFNVLLNECRAVVLAMRAIRKVNPNARLVQTDDLGKTFSTPPLRYQADYENERRWLTWDLLCGMVDRSHRMWKEMVGAGVPERSLRWFLENPCPPDIIGLNHYLSSERYLDHELGRYPPETHGGNAHYRYADVLASRVRAEGPAGPAEIFRETWERYRIPLAVTECQNGCTREEQIRWLWEVWHSAERSRAEGIDVRAVTLWSLLGAFDWDRLVTAQRDHYEPGVFDIRAQQPRPTAIAKLAKKLAERTDVSHPLLDVPGWWRRPQRLLYGHAITDRGRVLKAEGPQQLMSGQYNAVRPVLITGGRGTLARAFQRACIARGIPHRLLVRSQMDIADASSVAETFETFEPWAVINTAGYVRVDDAEAEPGLCYRENTKGPAMLAEECARSGVKLVTFSSDLVFDGAKSEPYVESDETAALNIYGRSKALAEREVLRALPEALVIRTSAFFSPWDRYNFLTIALQHLTAGKQFSAAADVMISPTYVPDLVEVSLNLLIDEESGIWHLANRGAVSWAGFALAAAERAALPTQLIEANTLDSLGLPALRPAYSVLESEKAWIMPTLESALDRYVADCELIREDEGEVVEPAA